MSRQSGLCGQSGPGGRGGPPKEYHEAVNKALVDLFASEWEVVEGPNDFKLKRKGEPPSAGKLASVPKRDGRNEFQRRIAQALVEVPWMLATIERLLEFIDPESKMPGFNEALKLADEFSSLREKVSKIKGGV